MLLIRMVLLLTGLLMTVVPGACTRKDQRGDLNAEKRIRQIGIWFVADSGHMDYYRKIFLKIDYDFGQMKKCLLTKYFDVIS